MAATIFYDGDCPFCSKYTSLLKLREAAGPVILVDLRSNSVAVSNLESRSFDLDRGMVLELEGKMYYGADAMNRLSLLSTESGWFNRLNALIFASPQLAALLYPLLRAGRGALLFALGRSRLRQDDESALSASAIFMHAFGMYGIADLLYQYYLGTLFSATWAFGLTAVYLVVRPRSPRVFMLLAASMLAHNIAQMPVQSNHAILMGFTLAAMAGAATYVWLRGRSWICFMESFAPLGRCLLVTMYFFGVFHKLNTGFLDPAVSCAAELWKAMPGTLPLIDGWWWRQAMIYGTLVGESMIMVGLLVHRTRYIAILLGIAFHSILALSNYGFYLAFSTLTISLHVLFLSPGAASRIVSAPSWRLLQARMHTVPGLIAVVAWVGALLLLAWLGHFTSVALLWMPWSIWLMCLVAKYGRERKGETPVGPAAIYSRTWALNALTVAFFLNCLMPYFGLKNAQAMNMFANLTYEGGHSNHLVFSKPPTYFGYLNDVVKPLAADPEAIDRSTRKNIYMTYYALLDMLDRNPSMRISFIRGGVVYKDQSAATLAADMTNELHPRWMRNWFHFRNFNAHGVEACEPGQ